MCGRDHEEIPRKDKCVQVKEFPLMLVSYLADRVETSFRWRGAMPQCLCGYSTCIFLDISFYPHC